MMSAEHNLYLEVCTSDDLSRLEHLQAVFVCCALLEYGCADIILSTITVKLSLQLTECSL